MALDGTYETQLLRILIGFLHISVSQQLALVRHGKAFEKLTPEEKEALQKDMVLSVMTIAGQLSETALKGGLEPPMMN